MEEAEFRSIYYEMNALRCVFEKALNARRCQCSKSKHFLLAGREGQSCSSENQLTRCNNFLHHIRVNARFSLGTTQTNGPLPHNKEIQIQVGSILALQKLSIPQEQWQKTPDIDQILTTAEAQHSPLEDWPFNQILSEIQAFQGRRKSR